MRSKTKALADILLTASGLIIASPIVILVPFILIMVMGIVALAYLRVFRDWSKKLPGSFAIIFNRYARS